MLSSIMKLLFRNFSRNVSYSIITVSSLVLGLTTALVLFVWMEHEFTFNRQMPDSQRVYALLANELIEGEVVTQEGTNFPLMNFLTYEIPEVESLTRRDNSNIVLSNGEKSVQKIGVYADSGFFKLYPPERIAGDFERPFKNKHAIVISKRLADLLFENQDALGKMILADRKNEFVVAGVFAAFPDNSSFDYIDFILPYDSKPRASDEWVNYDLKLFDASTRQTVEQKIDKKYFEVFKHDKTKALLFCLDDWRLHWSFENGKPSGGRIVHVLVFCITGIFVLIMACVNYMNIATARATKRTREIGVRKMTGASQNILIRQFMTESMIVTCFAAFVSLILAYALLPFFNQLVGINLSISLSDPTLLVGLFGISLFTGLLAGAYPAFLLSSFKPAVVLKGNLYSALSGAGLRRALVIFQFTLSIIVIFCAVVMWQQTNYLLKKDVGYDKHRILNIWLEDDVHYSFDNLRSSVLAHTAVESGSFGGASPMEVNGYAGCNRVEAPFLNPLLFYGANVDENLLTTLKFEFVQGRNFSRDLASDSSNFIITQKAADLLGLDSPIGQRITYNMFGQQEGEIIGVIKDFQNDDIHNSVKPVVFVLGKRQYLRNMFVRYSDGKLENAIDHLTRVFEKIQPGIPLSYSFLDADYEDQLYREKLIGNISIWFTVITIIIACLGLFGLVLFTTQRRTKEIGVRKVFGASVNQVTIMLCHDFMSPIAYSFVVAFPIAYYLMQNFLEAYSYRIIISGNTFMLVGFAMTILVLMTISYQSRAAAGQNPINSLKNE
jgi:putative ABC transport system permease protein